MSDDCVIVGSVQKSPIGSPPLKKLKQSRLPFAPVNNKSPKQNDKSSDKKRKLSGSDSPCTTPKTPRSESKDPAPVPVDENDVTEEKKDSSGTGKSSVERKVKEGASKKRGRPPGAKSKSKDESFASSQSDSSPAVKKGRKSVSDLDSSIDLGKSSRSQKDKLEVIERSSSPSGKDEAELRSDDAHSRDSVLSREEEVDESEDDNDKEVKDAKDKKPFRSSSRTPSKKPSSVVDDKDANAKGSDKKLVSGKDEKATVGRKRGRPAGSKKKSPDESFTSSQGSISPVGKRGRKSISKLAEDSYDADKSSHGEKEEIDADEDLSRSESNSGDPLPERKGESEGKQEDSGDSPQKLLEDTASESVEDSVESADKKDEEKQDESGKESKVSESEEVSIPETLSGKNEDNDKSEKESKSLPLETAKGSEETVSGKKEDDDKPGKTESKALALEKEKGSEGRNVKEGTKKRGRPFGSKKKSKLGSFTSPKGRPSVSDLDQSCDESNSSLKDEKSVNETGQSAEDATELVGGKDKADAKDEANLDQSPVNSTDKPASTSSKSVEETKDKNITPQGKDSAKKHPGRPSGSKNRNKSRSSLNRSICSNASEEENSSASSTPVGSKKNKKPVEKTRNILALFASVSMKKKDSSKDERESKSNQAKPENGKSNKDDKDEKVEKDTISKEELNKSTGDKTEDSKEDDHLESTESERSRNLNESVDALEASASEAEMSFEVGKSPLSDAKATGTPGSKGDLLPGERKLTPKQKEREAAKMMKIEEKEKQKQAKEEEKERQKQEREKQLQEKMAEKERQRKQKEEEKQKQKEEKEKAKEEIRKKRQEEIDAKKQKKEEELRKKEEEKQKKLEEQQRIEEEKRKQSDKLKNKFASFFVAKKREAESVEKDTEGPFKDFRVKEDMHLAPVVRNRLTEDQIAELDKCVATSRKDKSKTYLSVLRSGSYVKKKSEKTWLGRKEPTAGDDDYDDDNDDDDVMVVDGSDDEDIGNCSAMVQDPAASLPQGKKCKAKLLYFCENRRPAYWGTWSKKSSVVSARRPFAQDGIFDYEYDSDDDWEEEETGESLSDSEGEEKEEKEEGDQYEVDNDFFVPHGYLSDDEGKSDEEEEGAADSEAPAKAKDADRTKNTEQLKQKQAEFEEEMKQKTKVLKPRLFGCLWMADENNNPAYDQLMKILGPHKAITLCSQLPIGSRLAAGQPKEHRDTDGEDESGPDGRPGNFKKYEKTFPEEAVPALIKLLHGNRHGKGKLCREFVDYWRKLTSGELDPDMINHTPNKTSVSRTVYISKRKVEAKIQELGSWKRCLDEPKARHHMCWYVSQKKRDEYDMGDLSITNSWTYISKLLNDKKEEAESEEETPKVNKIRPITAFAKKMPSTPSSTNTSPSSTPGTTPINGGFSADTPGTAASSSFGNTPSSSAAENTPSRIQPVSGKKSKKKNLFASKSQDSSTPQKSSIISYFKKNKGISPQPSKLKPKENKGVSLADADVIMLE